MARKGEGSWRTKSEGLPDDFDMWIQNSFFGRLEDYVDNQGEKVPLLVLEGESPEYGEQSVHLSIGKGWEIISGGKEVRHESREFFDPSSKIGMWIDRIETDMPGLLEELERRGHPQEAGNWIGIGLHLQREDHDYGGDIGEVEIVMPTAFLGVQDDGPASTATETTEEPVEDEVEEIETEEVEVEVEESSGVSAGTMKRLAVIASKFDYDKFLDLALDIPEVEDDNELTMDILDDTDEGFWGRHQE